MPSKKPEENPEALATFAATAKNAGIRPKDDAQAANEKTKAVPVDPKLKDEAARQVLRAGIDGTTKNAQEAVKKIPDRTKQ